MGSKITVDGDCSNETKRHLFLGRKAMTNLDSVLKSRDTKGNKNRPKKKKMRERERDITLPTKVHVVKAMIFPGAMYRCES